MDLGVKLLLTVVLLSSSNVQSATRVRRLTVAEKSPNSYFYTNIPGHPGAYSFNYDITDEATGNSQYRNEDRYPNGTVAGAYGYVDAFGAPQRFRYVADQAGYRVFRDFFKPFYGQTTVKPIDKFAIDPPEDTVTWSRPKRPNKNNANNIINTEKYNGERRYDLIRPPSFYVPYD